MAAPKNNQFWLLRSKHGRDKLFASPELMWLAACEYFEWCDKNPFIATEFYGKDAIECRLPKMRPFTMQGLCLYLDCSTSYFRTFKSVLKEENKDFLAVITRIEEIVYNQKFSGAASGFFNANIISRDLGLSEKQDNRLVDADGNDRSFDVTLNLR